MNSDPLHCTHCNAMVYVSEKITSPKRLRCCQCDEIFVHPAGASVVDDSNVLDTQPLNPVATPTTSNSRVALIAIAMMAAVAGITLIFALRTTDYREKVTLKKKGDLADYAPADLPALAYVPKDADVVVGVHVANLLHTTPGKQLLEETTRGVGWMLTQFEQATGIAPAGIDHLVCAVDTSDLSNLAFIVRTRAPYPQQAIAQDTRSQSTTFRGKPAYRLQMKRGGSGWLWCVDDKTLVLLWQIGFGKLGKLDRFPSQAQTNLQGLSPSLRDLLTKRVDKRGRLWLVADLDAKIKHVAMSAQFMESLTMVGSAQGKTEKETREIATVLEKQGVGLKIFPPPEKIENDEQNWVQWQYRGDPLAIWPMVKNLLEIRKIPIN